MLDKRSKRVLWIFGLALLGIILTEILRPTPVDWRNSYTSTDKIPMGCYIFYNEIEPLFNKIDKINTDPYEFLTQSEAHENSAYIFINSNIYFDKRQTEKLMEYVEDGNTVFVSSHVINGKLSDTLNLSSRTSYTVQEKDIYPQFFSPSLKQDSLVAFRKAVYESKLIKIDTSKAEALGFYGKKTSFDLNYIAIPHGKGQFLIHTLPEAFTNYYMLKTNGQYAADVLSYINSNHVYWDEYIKEGRVVISSPMRFVLSQDALIWAYYLLLGGLLIFVLFKGKREQRIIPVVEPLKNSSVEFTQTVGDLYFQHSDYSNIIAKKITYFLENIRSQFFLNTQELSTDFIKKLAIKSGNTEEETQDVIQFISHLKEKSVHSEQDLIQLNKKIDDFRL